MKILSIGSDATAVRTDSALAERLRAYATHVERYDVLVPALTRVHADLAKNSAVYSGAGSTKLLQLYRMYKEAQRLMRMRRYDVVTVQDPYYLGVLAYLVARRFHAGLEVQVHGWERLCGARRLCARFVLRHAHAVRVVSMRIKRQLLGEFSVAEGKITVIPIYTEVRNKEKKERRREHDIPFVFLTVGRLVPVKRIDLQIEAMVEVVKKYPHTELWIAGEGRERRKLEARSKNQGVSDGVKFLGWVNDLEKVYKQADTLVLSSDYEGWGLVVIEAAAQGLPIMMTDVGCAGEVIVNEQSGLVISVGNVRALANAMMRLREDVALRETLAQGARNAIAKLPTRGETLMLYQQSWEMAYRETQGGSKRK